MVSVSLDDDLDDSDYDVDGEEVEEIISEIEDECSLVLSNRENGDLLNKIFELARTNYEKDQGGWADFFADLKVELIATDDEDNTREILDHYHRKAKMELT
jgi:hypothetical protein